MFANGSGISIVIDSQSMLGARDLPAVSGKRLRAACVASKRAWRYIFGHANPYHRIKCWDLKCKRLLIPKFAVRILCTPPAVPLIVSYGCSSQ